MKKNAILLMAIFVISSLFSFNLPESKQTDVFYFHFSRRCATCLNLEKVAKESVEALYPEQVKKGEITFQSVNLDEDSGEALGKKYNIEGQTLIVICGDKRVDLTDKGFLYVNTKPEKLKEEIKAAVERLNK